MSAVRKQLYYIWKKLSERETRTKLATKFYKNDLERFEKCNERKPAAQIKQELKALQRYWNCYPFHYYRFDMYRKDCTLSLEEIKTYVPLFFLNNLFFPLSFKDYGIVCEDKLLTYALLKAYEIPQPRLLFCYDNKTFFDAENNPITPSQTDAIINVSAAGKLFVKARFGSEGKGIFTFGRDDKQRFVDENDHVFDHHFFTEDIRVKSVEGRDNTGFFIVQEGLVQHESLNHIYPHAVNTFRFNTECVNGNVTILHTLMRMGSGGEQVDNASSGGMYIKVDKDTGLLGDYAFMSDRSIHQTHPDTGFIFKGARIEAWPQVKAFALAAAKKFREMRYLGWDIALTNDGLSVIEVNHHPGFNMVQDCYGGARDDLKINPKDWWYQSNYTIKNI
jgi:hypothetical protein